MVSIAAAQIFFAVAFISLLLSRNELRFPPRLLYPLLAFSGWTLLSLAFSDSPVSGVSKLRKLPLLLILLLIYSVYKRTRQVKIGMQGMSLAAGLAGCVGVVQFVVDYTRYRQEGVALYKSYVAHQISGFMSHWLTFGAELMLVTVLLVALLLFLPSQEFPRTGALLLLPLSASIILSFTRGIWIATLASVGYLIIRSKRRLLLFGFPVLLIVVALAAPSWLQDRIRSIGNTHSDSSNQARIVMLKTGIEMIKRHPVFGVGLERVGPEFLSYKPPTIPLPDGWYGHLHSNYLQIAAERGIPCLLILLWLFFEILKEGIALTQHQLETSRAMGQLIVAATIALMIGGLFEYNFGDSEVLMTYLYLIAAANAWARLSARESAIVV